VNARRLLRLAACGAPWLLLQCGESGDLVIGRLGSGNAILPDASSGGADAAPDALAGALNAGGSAGTADGGEPSAAGSAGEAGSGGSIVCEGGETPVAGSLLHHYDFSGSGSAVPDLAGDADGVVLGPNPDVLDDGHLVLDGETDTYVNLPNGIVSSLDDATFVVWTNWSGGAGYQRVFDFGTNENGEDMRGHGENYFALIPFTNTQSGHLVVELTGTDGIDQISTPTDIVEDVEHQMAVVVRSGQSIEFYLDAELLGSVQSTGTLAGVVDVNNWLGRSNYPLDPPYNGSFNDFRIYDAALDACVVRTLFEAGPNVLP
jgi:hypothetical protein